MTLRVKVLLSFKSYLPSDISITFQKTCILRVNTVHIVISFTISDITSTLVVLWNVCYTECDSKRNFVCEKLRGISELLSRFDVRGSVHHSIIHAEITNKMQQCIRIYYSVFT